VSATLDSLVGRWRKVSAPACAADYPDELEILARGTHRGRQRDGGYAVWDAGSVELVDEGRVRISTANDAEPIYQFTLDGRRLTFVDPQGCSFTYERERS